MRGAPDHPPASPLLFSCKSTCLLPALLFTNSHQAVRRKQAAENAEMGGLQEGGLEKDIGASSSDDLSATPAADAGPVPWWKRASLWVKKTFTCSSLDDVASMPAATLPPGSPWWRRCTFWIKETIADNVMFLLVFFTILREVRRSTS
jgi:hypothetical protein